MSGFVPLGDGCDPGVVVRHVGPQPEEGVEAAVVREQLGPAVAQVPLAHQVRAVARGAQLLGQQRVAGVEPVGVVAAHA